MRKSLVVAVPLAVSLMAQVRPSVEAASIKPSAAIGQGAISVSPGTFSVYEFAFAETDSKRVRSAGLPDLRWPWLDQFPRLGHRGDSERTERQRFSVDSTDATGRPVPVAGASRSERPTGLRTGRGSERNEDAANGTGELSRDGSQQSKVGSGDQTVVWFVAGISTGVPKRSWRECDRFTWTSVSKSEWTTYFDSGPNRAR